MAAIGRPIYQVANIIGHTLLVQRRRSMADPRVSIFTASGDSATLTSQAQQHAAIVKDIECINGAAGPQQKKAVFQLSTSLQSPAAGSFLAFSLAGRCVRVCCNRW